MIAEILPPPVAAVEAFDDPPGATLFPEEEAAMARAAARRRSEFTAGRACARAALAGLGLPATAIVPGQRGAPQWPPGVVGSITHCDGYRASAVAFARDVITLGLDAEPDGPLPGGVLDVVALAEERDRLPGLAAAAPQVPWDRLLFCAKEAVYKAWFPLTGRWLGFEQAADHVRAGRGHVHRPAAGGRPGGGRASAGPALRPVAGPDGLVLAAIALPA